MMLILHVIKDPNFPRIWEYFAIKNHRAIFKCFQIILLWKILPAIQK